MIEDFHLFSSSEGRCRVTSVAPPIKTLTLLFFVGPGDWAMALDRGDIKFKALTYKHSTSGHLLIMYYSTNKLKQPSAGEGDRISMDLSYVYFHLLTSKKHCCVKYARLGSFFSTIYLSSSVLPIILSLPFIATLRH